MLNLLIPRRMRDSSAPRRITTTLANAFRSVVTPAGLVAELAPVTAPDPSDVYTVDELPPVAEIEAAAAEYDRSADQARRADRGKRAAKKVLDKLPAGTYGAWRIFRNPSSRMTPDLAAITATYKALGLGAVPMKPCAPSLKVERAEVLAGVAA